MLGREGGRGEFGDDNGKEDNQRKGTDGGGGGRKGREGEWEIDDDGKEDNHPLEEGREGERRSMMMMGRKMTGLRKGKGRKIILVGRGREQRGTACNSISFS